MGDVVYEYFYADSRLMRMTISDGTVMDFFYDHNGLPYAVKYNGTNYYYILNQQGDVVRLISADGTTVGTYQYDAWGNILSSTDNDLTNANPLRYRGYVYDDETGFYYLSSRYYDPKIGRFINADGQINADALVGYNLFASCYNSPVMLSDSSGNRPILSMSTANETATEKEMSFAYMNRPAHCNGGKTTKNLSKDEKVLVATIAAEATVTAKGTPASSAARQAMANVVMNRIGVREWSKYNTVSEICAYTGFDGYGDTNYEACMAYLNERDGSNMLYESIIAEVIPIYRGEIADITEGCQLYYTPAAMRPAGSSPSWNFNVLEEILIPGVDPYYEGRFFKYR